MTALARQAPTRLTISARLTDLARAASEIWTWAQRDPKARIFAKVTWFGLALATAWMLPLIVEVRRNGPHLGPVTR